MLRRNKEAIVWAGVSGLWLLVVAVALGWPRRDWWLGGGLSVLAILTLMLVLLRDCPWRREGLMFSWIGPFILTAERIVINWLLLRNLHQADVSHLTARIVQTSLVDALFLAVFAIWLFRGYGLIPLLATMSIILRKRPGSVERMAQEYPGPRWWQMPVFFLLLGILTALGYYVMISWATRYPDM